MIRKTYNGSRPIRNRVPNAPRWLKRIRGVITLLARNVLTGFAGSALQNGPNTATLPVDTTLAMFTKSWSRRTSRCKPKKRYRKMLKTKYFDTNSILKGSKTIKDQKKFASSKRRRFRKMSHYSTRRKIILRQNSNSSKIVQNRSWVVGKYSNGATSLLISPKTR